MLTDISIQEAQAKILEKITPIQSEVVALSQASGRILAEDIKAKVTQPPYDLSAMDGYAVRAQDTLQSSPLTLIGEASAGKPFEGILEEGRTVRVFTGSVMPQGSDAVLIQENATVKVPAPEEQSSLPQITPLQKVETGQHVRKKGGDFTENQIILGKSERLTSRHIGLLAAAGYSFVTVYRKLRIALLTTGDELTLPGEPLPKGGIFNSNAFMLKAFIEAQGAEAVILPSAKDTPESIRQAFSSSERFDLFVTCGGVSVGSYDFVRQSLEEAGFTLDFWKVAIRPGKPLMFAHSGKSVVIGLPGNPVSSFVGAILFLLPALALLGGRGDFVFPYEQAVTAQDLPKTGNKTTWLRAFITPKPDGLQEVNPVVVQDSSYLNALTRADALLLRPADAPPVKAGSIVTVLKFSSLNL